MKFRVYDKQERRFIGPYRDDYKTQMFALTEEGDLIRFSDYARYPEVEWVEELHPGRYDVYFTTAPETDR